MRKKIDPRQKRITDKFYKTEEERQQLLANNQEHILALQAAIGDQIMYLWEKDIAFHIYWIDANIKKLHCGLLPCCNSSKKQVPREHRTLIENEIKLKTIFNEVVWEI